MQNLNLHREIRQILFGLEFAQLAGAEGAGEPIAHFVHLAEGAVAQFADQLPGVGWDLVRFYVVEAFFLFIVTANVQRFLKAA